MKAVLLVALLVLPALVVAPCVWDGGGPPSATISGKCVSCMDLASVPKTTKAGEKFDCTSCYSGYRLTDVSPKDCLPCANGCASCVEEYTVGKCLRCNGRFYLSLNTGSTEQGTCMSCLADCLDCNDAVSCTRCDYGFYYVAAVGNTAASCTMCLQDCSNCKSAGQCSSCKYGFKLTPQEGTKAATCTTDCPAGYTYKNTENQCVKNSTPGTPNTPGTPGAPGNSSFARVLLALSLSVQVMVHHLN